MGWAAGKLSRIRDLRDPLGDGMKDSPDTLAHEQLLAELGWVAALAHRLVSDPNVADDVLQRVCLVALEKPPRNVSGTAGIRRWLSTLTRRTAAHSRRSEGRRAKREERAARAEALPSTVNVAERREVLHQLVDALSDLEANDRLLLTQRYFEGLCIAEIAHQLDVSEGTLRQRLSRARRRLRERLERDAGAGRERWLAALAPLTAPLAAHPTLTIPPALGASVMAKVASSLVVKIALGVGVLTVAVVTAWQGMDPGKPVVVEAPGVIKPVADSTPEPAPLPVVSGGSGDDSIALAANVPQPIGAAVEPAGASAVEEMPASGLATLLDEATASFLTAEPDLQALNEALRRLALAARVLPDTVARNPLDGSVNGWLEIEGTGVQAEWQRDAEGRYHVDFGIEPGEDSPEGFIARGLDLRFTDSGGRAGEISTAVQFHPDTSEEGLARLLPSLDGQEHHVGWHLTVSHLGTVGSPISMQQSKHGNAVTITASGGLPSLSETWANDTSPYDSWLALLRHSAP